MMIQGNGAGRMFGHKRKEMVGGWRSLHNEELRNLYASPDVFRVVESRRIRLAEHVVSIGEMRNTYKVVVVKPEGKRPLGRPRRRWEVNIRMVLRETEWNWLRIRTVDELL
jgi:hypothetical protein